MLHGCSYTGHTHSPTLLTETLSHHTEPYFPSYLLALYRIMTPQISSTRDLSNADWSLYIPEGELADTFHVAV